MYTSYLIKAIYVILLVACLNACNSNTTNDTPSSSSPTHALRVACVGDSITEGYTLSNMAIESYPSQLSMLVANDVEVRNFGIRGATVLKKSNYPYWDTRYYKQSKQFNPEIVVLMFGTNDIKNINWNNKKNFIPDYSALINSYKKLNTKPTIYICLPPPSYTNVQGITNKRMIQELIPNIKQVAQRNEVGIIDIHTLLTNKEALFSDKIHPNAEGARQIAEAVYRAIY